jgi:hypothetical protein
MLAELERRGRRRHEASAFLLGRYIGTRAEVGGIRPRYPLGGAERPGDSESVVKSRFKAFLLSVYPGLVLFSRNSSLRSRCRCFLLLV